MNSSLKKRLAALEASGSHADDELPTWDRHALLRHILACAEAEKAGLPPPPEPVLSRPYKPKPPSPERHARLRALLGLNENKHPENVIPASGG
jgi:hypothetical protein